jgi:hypothetical protein
MSSSICPRCGGKEFRQHEEHTYVDSEKLGEENKHVYKKQLICVKCDFEFPST